MVYFFVYFLFFSSGNSRGVRCSVWFFYIISGKSVIHCFSFVYIALYLKYECIVVHWNDDILSGITLIRSAYIALVSLFCPSRRRPSSCFLVIIPLSIDTSPLFRGLTYTIDNKSVPSTKLPPRFWFCFLSELVAIISCTDSTWLSLVSTLWAINLFGFHLFFRCILSGSFPMRPIVSFERLACLISYPLRTIWRSQYASPTRTCTDQITPGSDITVISCSCVPAVFLSSPDLYWRRPLSIIDSLLLALWMQNPPNRPQAWPMPIITKSSGKIRVEAKGGWRATQTNNIFRIHWILSRPPFPARPVSDRPDPGNPRPSNKPQ